MSTGNQSSVGVSFSGNVGEKIPLVNRRRQVFDYFTSLFGNSNYGSDESSKDGYVEFGNIGEATSGRTLGLFAGVFAPVCLSMFSAMLFLRVGMVTLRHVNICFILCYEILTLVAFHLFRVCHWKRWSY